MELSTIRSQLTHLFKATLKQSNSGNQAESAIVNDSD